MAKSINRRLINQMRKLPDPIFNILFKLIISHSTLIIYVLVRLLRLNILNLIGHHNVFHAIGPHQLQNIYAQLFIFVFLLLLNLIICFILWAIYVYVYIKEELLYTYFVCIFLFLGILLMGFLFFFFFLMMDIQLNFDYIFCLYLRIKAALA